MPPKNHKGRYSSKKSSDYKVTVSTNGKLNEDDFLDFDDYAVAMVKPPKKTSKISKPTLEASKK